jgi:hypothetical protein
MQAKTSDGRQTTPRLVNRIARLERRAAQLEILNGKYWRARRTLFVCGCLLALLFCKLSGSTAGLAPAAFFLAVFVVVAIYQNRVSDSLTRNALMLNIKQIQIARINLDWEQLPRSEAATPESGSAPEQHSFATDLDIIGERSLHRLLDSAVTQEGSRRLKSWLLSERPDAQIIKKRQSLVRELSGLSLFRDKLHLHAAIAGRESQAERKVRQSQMDRWDANTLVRWLEHGAHEVGGKSLRSTVIQLALLAALNLALLVLALLDLVPHVWPLVFLIYVGVMIAKQSRIMSAWGEVQDLENTLRRFGAVFQYLESRRYRDGAQLAQVCAPFLDPHKRPSAEMRRVERIAAALGLRTNAMLWLLANAIVPWDFFFTYRLERLKNELSQLVPRWLDAWYELEALNSLANFAWLNPSYEFPEVVSAVTQLDAGQLGHPLIKPEHKICNDFELDENHRIVILTGSNMAGKSTFLRTVGLNLCLAYAGAPVSAERFRTSLFRLFTCIKVSDSVQDGLSYFYAEVKRLKLLLAAAQTADDLPFMFLIDEIFRGTNNRERHIGSYAFIRALSQQLDAFGLIATHDLELTGLAGEIPGIVNAHFREEVGEGRMVFDYQLRPGPCPTTNALKIMRIEGLPVDVSEDI